MFSKSICLLIATIFSLFLYKFLLFLIIFKYIKIFNVIYWSILFIINLRVRCEITVFCIILCKLRRH